MPTNKILDEFTDLPISAHAKFILRRKKAGLCHHCPKPAVLSGRCLDCAVDHREDTRLRKDSLNRYKSITYELESVRYTP